MLKIVEWLISMEQLSEEIYRNAAGFLKDDAVLAPYLTRLADDEMRHVEIMKKAADHLRSRSLPPSEITLDEASKEKWELPFHANRVRISAGTLDRETILDCIVTTESSEWNDFFQYVINALKGEDREFEAAASEIERHKGYIEAFVKTLSSEGDRLDRLRSLPKIWEQRVLIVDDYEPMRKLIADMLSHDVVADTADCGEEAAKKLEDHHYDMVLTDDFMPGMNGTELYRLAALHDPLASDRFLFLLDDIQPEHLDFIRQHGLKYLTKPFSVKEFRETVNAILAAISHEGRA